jgi:hypothetical protein
MHRAQGLTMPAIRLRSARNTLRSACDHPIDLASIGLLSVAITLLLSPLIPPADRSPALGLGRPVGSASGREGKRKRKDLVIGTTLVTVGILRTWSTVPQLMIILNWISAGCRRASGSNKLAEVGSNRNGVTTAADFARLCVPCASHPSGARVQTPHKPVRHSETPDRRSLSKHQRETTARTRQRTCWRNLKYALLPYGFEAGRPGRGGWGPRCHGRPISDYRPSFAASSRSLLPLCNKDQSPKIWRRLPKK